MMSEEVKHCAVCGKVISTPENDYFSHIKIKYCDSCREVIRREQARNRVNELRKRKKEKDKFRDKELELMKEKVRLLTEENELLKIENQRKREQINQQSKSVITQIRKKVSSE
ncbi:MAG: hypothetical protein IJJ69_14210 [Oscillospiraceae bacterium]|nr:hypothetical protein [Oscillospiraceae bacterium]